ncbi:MFS transporter [Tumebacillus sp. DT12]|uniref:MFS transporter n=1 Tax=Tumebacillus lacus TaxID=2995335 RepID=A0ABT3X6T0_9BACL|nr:MFS transporter [Tumebacillus lacus]MCX7571371.1 MFS transporter [Tumebacillus lacus]
MTAWMNQNIRSLYLYVFCSGLYFDRALWVLYLGERGMNMAQVGVLEAFLHLIILFFEVPTGIVADLYGRKKSLLIGQFISIFYALFMMISGNFFLFSLAFGLMGLGITFKSGAEQALLYETLKANGEEKRYTRLAGSMTALVLVSMSLAKWVGGYMAEWSWTLVYSSIIIFQFLALAPLVFLREPQREQEPEPAARRSLKEAWRNQFIDSLKVWNAEQSVRGPILGAIAVSTVMVVVIFYAQEYFSRLGYSPSEIGFIMMLESLIGAAAAKLAHRVDSRWPFRTAFNGIYYLFVALLVLFALLNGWLAVLSMLILGMLSTLLDPIFDNFIQSKVTSNIRATFFSMISLLTSLSIMIFFPLFGAVVDEIGFSTSFLLLVAPLIAIGLFASFRLRSVVDREE